MTAAEVIAQIIEKAPHTAHRDGSIVDAMRWALQEAGYDSSERETALLDAHMINPIDMDWGAMVYDRPDWLGPFGPYAYRDGKLVRRLEPAEDSEIPGLWWVGDENFPNQKLAQQYADRQEQS